VAEEDGDDDRREVDAATGKQRHSVHDVQRQPAQREHGQHHAEPLGRSDFLLPCQLPCVISRRRLLLLLLLLIRMMMMLRLTVLLRVVNRRLVYIIQAER